MCTRPITKDGNTFACGSCDECISARRWQWVARAMAEKSMHAHAACVTLTYSDASEVGYLGARMFAYEDIKLFMGRLRRAARYTAEKEHWNLRPQIRFLAAGEQGDRNGRCHWHLIIYSNFDLSRLGKFRLRGKLVRHRADMLTVGKRKRRLNWTLWPHGFMTLQEPDEGAMHYVLSYCLKDQFTAEKSMGTMREAKSENFATGLFRMSKRPAIGESWLWKKLEALDQSGTVLPSTMLKVPDMRGYWYPSGLWRKKLLWALTAINLRRRWRTGRDAPQWSTLLSNCASSAKDLEILNGTPTSPEEDPNHPDYRDPIGDLVFRQREQGHEFAKRQVARRCGAKLPCDDCLSRLDSDQLAALGVKKSLDAQSGYWRYDAAEGAESVQDRQRESGGGLNPFCAQQGSKLHKLAFPRSHPKGPSGRS